MTIAVRCPGGNLLFNITDEGLVEIKCRSSRCGHGDGTVVFHYFEPTTGLLKETKQYKDPAAPHKRRIS